MKRVILLTLLLALGSFGLIYSQSVPSTGDGALPCRLNCPNNGWMGAWKSSVNKAGGEFPWSGAPLPAPPSNPVGADGGKYFVTAYSSNTIEMGATAQMTGLIPGRKYTVKCYMMSSRAQLESGMSDYGEQGKIETIGGFAFVNFTSGGPFGSNVNQWIEATFKFTALYDKQTLGFIPETNTEKGGFVNLDLRGDWLTAEPCNAGTAQVNVNATINNVCPANTADLTTAITGPVPQNASVVWYNTPDHTGVPVIPGTAGAGTYYAFFYDSANGCYNTENSTAKVTVAVGPCCKAGTAQAQVSSTLSNVCPATTANLADAVTGPVPQGASVVWYATPNHSGVPVIPGTAPAGTYYAFFYDSQNDCYNTANSTATVTVTINSCQPTCGAGSQPVPLKAVQSKILCPATTVNLITEFHGGIKSPNIQLRFFTNPNHTGTPISDPNVGEGTYYAFYYDPANSCYNQNVSTAKVTVGYQKCADVTPTVQINALNFNPGVSRDFVVNLYEVNGGSTTGTVTLKISKLGGFTISYSPLSEISQVFGGTQNENGRWSFSEDANFITATSFEPIPANGQATIGFKLTRKAGALKGLSQNITATVVGGSGGELNSENNLTVTTISTN
ncbi:hypothetical protein [Dyadobacter aurulentus]|uniref:hypothetical protein n=1 Tax=Dyadobacter sp. UC 10 TaxID=2605428 RepID=UPI0011F31F60|nr:hypothetical protein [Dyadobacter sp. UC 10]KAA0993803.1 hypothetical protein FXO21_28290 [Dyadobacter sp. UC 10]